MQKMRIRFVAWMLPVLTALTLLVAQAASAQDPATDAAACELVPLELPLFDGTPVASFSTPAVVATPAADQVTDEAIQHVLAQYVACTNTGDPTLIWAMFSPRWFAATFSDPQEHYLPAFEQMLTLPGSDQEGVAPLEVVEIVEIVQLPDGKVDVTATFRSGDQEWTDTLTLVLVDDQWLIDDVHLDIPAE